MKFLEKERHYVYELVDPRSESVFYVGKGSGDRAQQHERGVRGNSEYYKRRNPKLFNKILKILQADLSVEIRIVLRCQNEQDAFSYEKKRIDYHGLEHLCNLTPGGAGGDTFTYALGKDIKRKNMRDSWTPERLADHKKVAQRNWSGNRNPMHKKENKKRMLGEENPMRKPEIVKKVSGERHHSSRLNLDVVQKMREQFEQGLYTQAELAKIYGISRTQVSNIVRFKQWKNI